MLRSLLVFRHSSLFSHFAYSFTVSSHVRSVVMNNLHERILENFPSQFSYAFAYGSGVFAQKSQDRIQDNVIDFIFAVDNPFSWHRSNLKMNRWHYSFLKYGGADLIQKVQKNYGAKIYFNTLIPVENTMIKYGVISSADLIEDLLDWQTLYVSGRLHKPVAVLKEPTDEIKKAIDLNLQSALHTSLICLPECFSLEQLFLKIAGLSYSGDFRMYIGEDKNKVKNIVTSQLDKFGEMYESHLKAMPLVYWNQGLGVYEQDCSPSSVLHHLNLLPRRVQRNLLIEWNKNGHFRDMEEVIQALSYESDCSDMVLKAVRDIVWWPTLTQSVKGLISAGFLKSVKYSSKKLMKMFHSLKK